MKYDKALPNNVKPIGFLKMGEAKAVETKMEAWGDRTIYEVPFFGTCDEKRIRAAIHRLGRPGTIIGSSYGSTSYSFISLDSERGIVRYSVYCGIGE